MKSFLFVGLLFILLFNGCGSGGSDGVIVDSKKTEQTDHEKKQVKTSLKSLLAGKTFYGMEENKGVDKLTFNSSATQYEWKTLLGKDVGDNDKEKIAIKDEKITVSDGFYSKLISKNSDYLSFVVYDKNGKEIKKFRAYYSYEKAKKYFNSTKKPADETTNKNSIISELKRLVANKTFYIYDEYGVVKSTFSKDITSVAWEVVYGKEIGAKGSDTLDMNATKLDTTETSQYLLIKFDDDEEGLKLYKSFDSAKKEYLALIKESDKIAPVITLNGNKNITIIQGKSYTELGATANDNVDGNITNKIKITGKVDTAKVGTYSIKYTATDSVGNIATEVTRTVVVAKPVNKTAPIITLKGSVDMTIELGKIYAELGATAIDDIDGNLTKNIVKTGVVNTQKVGVYYITYSVKDSANNNFTIKRKVTVVDLTPIITLKGDALQEVYQFEEYNDLGATAVDSNNKTLTVKAEGKVDTKKRGSYTLIYKATDVKGRIATIKRVVKVIENPNLNIITVSNVKEFRKAFEDASINGKDDIILAKKGVYKTTEDGSGTFDFNDDDPKNLTIMADTNLTADDVVFDGDKTDRVFDFDNKKQGSVTLQNISVINGKDRGVTSNIKLIIKNSKIYDNESANSGAGIFSTSLILSKSEVYKNISTNNSSGSGGGGLCILNHLNISDSKIYENYSSNYGGGIYGFNISIKDSKIYENVAKYGGGIYSNGQYSKIDIKDSEVYENNTTDGSGGGIYAYSLKMDSSKIYNNIAKDDGGGIYTKYVTINNSEISNNLVEAYGGSGGGIHSNYDATILNSKISNNLVEAYGDYKTAGHGGGIYTRNLLILINNIIRDNKISVTSKHNSTTTADGPVFTTGDNHSYYLFNNTIVNNTSIKSDYTFQFTGYGMLYNNIIDKNDGKIVFKGDSRLLNNYINYKNYVNENSYNIIKKDNILPVDGDIVYNDDMTLSDNSIVIDKGINPAGSWFGDDYYEHKSFYDGLLKVIKRDITAKVRLDAELNNNIVDIGAYEK